MNNELEKQNRDAAVQSGLVKPEEYIREKAKRLNEESDYRSSKEKKKDTK